MDEFADSSEGEGGRRTVREEITMPVPVGEKMGLGRKWGKRKMGMGVGS
jgi:hypothetical protein